MQKSIVVIGIGEMAGVFCRGFLKSGYTVIPVTRDTDIHQAAQFAPTPDMVLLSVAEKDLHSSLETIPEHWKPQLALLQNELLPRDWQTHQLNQPTIISVWFEKKKGQDYKVLVPSPIYGPKAHILGDALTQLDIPNRLLNNAEELLFELVLKNVYILTTNISGLVVGGDVENLWNQHRDLAKTVAGEVIQLQEYLTGAAQDSNALIEGMVTAINGDPQHQCMGRSAPARLANALRIADEANLSVPKLREIHSKTVD
ncbi:MAG: hypothetical protein OEZ68_08210 [Gammaproteobacteria bacterium]|nr:hypothetical protein [Gammaproteobacteria bacterium]MDH5800771.1 hypothetical protein [Gammaproteobacteria bacterium]